LTAGPTPLALLRCAARRWLLTLAVAGLLGCAAGFALWRYVPLRHAAEVRLCVRPAPPGVTDNRTDDPAAELKGQADLVRDPLVLAQAAADPDLTSLAAARGWADPENKIAAALRVEAVPSDSGIRIRATDEAAADAAVIANAVKNGYLTELKNRRVRYVQQLRDALSRGPADVVKTPDTVPTPTPMPDPTPARTDDPRLAAAEAKLVQVRADRRKALGELLTLRETQDTRSRPAVTDDAVTRAYQNDDFVIRKQQELKPIEDVITRTVAIATLKEKEPSLRSYYARRDTILKELEARRTAIRKDLEERAGPKSVGPDLGPQIQAVQERADALARQEQSLKAEIESLREEAAKVVTPAPPPAPPVVRVDPPADSEARRKLEAELRLAQSQGVEPYWVTPLGEKTTVDADSVARRETIVRAGGAAGALLGVLFVGFVEYRTRRVRSARDVSRGLGMPVFGALPRRLAATARTLAEPGKDGAAVDVLGGRLLGAVPDGPCVVLVTGSEGGGQSALATHLAAGLARSWHKTVLIDADSPRSELQRALLLSEGPGLAGVLRGEAEPLDALEVTSLNRLWVMPAGRPDAASAQGLARGAGAILAALRDQFDCVVVNAATPGTVGDALLLARYCDAVVLAVEAGVSRVSAVHAARRQIEGAGGAVVGAAVFGAAGESLGDPTPPARRTEAAAVA
jgi:receptor protein-tyrosine kinase